MLVNVWASPGIFVHHEPNFVTSVTVEPGSPAARDGLRTGDEVDAARLSPAERIRWYMSGWSYGERIVVPVVRQGSHLKIAVTADRHLAASWTYWIGYCAAVWALSFAILLCVRRSDSAEARILVMLLALITMSIYLQYNWFTPWPALDAVVNALGQLCASVGFALLATYSMLFARPASGLRRVLVRITYALAAFDVVFAFAGFLGRWFGSFDWPVAIHSSITFCVSTGNTTLLPLCVATLAIAQSRGAERARLSWAVGALSFLYLSQFFGELIYAYALPVPDAVVVFIFNAGLFIAPVGLTYSVLTRRTLDVGFALNRAAIFAATTLLLAGLFAGLQWGASTALTGFSRGHGFVLQIAIAVVVYYVVRVTRLQTGALVTRLFFADRQRRINTIRKLARAVDEVQNADGVAPFAIDCLGAQAHIATTVLLPDDDGCYAPVEPLPGNAGSLASNDVAVVALRSSREPVCLSEGEFAGATAFPMLVRGRLRGVLVCRAPNDDDGFAPDELTALSFLATQIAVARDDLLAESLRKELSILRKV